MQRLIVCLGLILFLSKCAQAQISDDISEDSVKSLLCHKWGFRAIIIGDKEKTNFNESITYQFYNNKTLVRVSFNGKSEKGKWIYDREKKLITIKIKNTILYVVKLRLGDLVVSPDKIGELKRSSLRIDTALKIIEE